MDSWEMLQTYYQKNLVSGLLKIIAFTPPYYDALKKIRPEDVFKEEYCTIRLGLPRRIGNTQIAVELFEKIPRSILITHCMEAKKEFVSRMSSPAKKKRIFIIKEGLRGLNTNVLIADLPLYRPETITRLHSVQAKYYILLG